MEERTKKESKGEGRGKKKVIPVVLGKAGFNCLY